MIHLLFRAEWASTYLRCFLPNNKNAFARFDVQVLVHNFAEEDFLIACARVDFDVEVARMGRGEEGWMEQGGNEATRFSMKGDCLLGEAFESKRMNI